MCLWKICCLLKIIYCTQLLLYLAFIFMAVTKEPLEQSIWNYVWYQIMTVPTICLWHIFIISQQITVILSTFEVMYDKFEVILTVWDFKVICNRFKVEKNSYLSSSQERVKNYVDNYNKRLLHLKLHAIQRCQLYLNLIDWPSVQESRMLAAEVNCISLFGFLIWC